MKGKKSTALQAYDPQGQKSQRHAKAAAQLALRELTRVHAIRLLKAREATEGAQTKEWRTRAVYYLDHLVYGKALGISTPDDVKAAVRTMLKQACEETGLVLQPPKPRQRKKRR